MTPTDAAGTPAGNTPPQPPQPTEPGPPHQPLVPAPGAPHAGQPAYPLQGHQQPGAAPPPNYGGYVQPGQPGQPGGYHPPHGYHPPPGYPMQVSPPTNQTAIWALVCSILGLTCCGLLSIVGLVLSASAKREIELSGGTKGGAGLAKAAWIVGWVAVGIWVLWILGWGALAAFSPGSS